MRKLFFRTHHRSTRSRAQAIVEFALVLPLLLVVVVGIFEFSRLLFAWIILENSTRFGIRYATTGTYDPAYCVGLPGDVCDSDPEVDAARIPSIWYETQRMVIGFFKIDARLAAVSNTEDTYFNVTVCSDDRTFIPPQQGTDVYAECNLPDGSRSEHPGTPGNRVYVAADYNFKFMVMPLFGLGPERIHLASYRLGYVEQFRSARAINTPLPMNIPTSTASITPTPTITTTSTQTFTATVTNTPIPSATVTRTPTRTPTPLPTSSRTPTITRTPSRTPTITLTPTRTLSPTITLTPSRTPTQPTATRTLTPSRTPTRPTSTRTLSPTATLSRTPTRTRTATPTRTRTNTPAPATPTFTSPPPTNTPRPATNTPIPPTNAPTNTRTPTRPPATPTICLDC